jgi:hypothetical protein
MVNKMSLDKKILSEIERYRNINKYIMEQVADPAAIPPPPPPGDPAAPPPADPAAAAAPAAPTEPSGAEPIDVENDPDVEKIDDEGKSEEKGGEGDVEEMDITELVDSQKSIEKKQEEYFQNLFSQVQSLESKLSEMDTIMNKLNTLENKIEKYRQKTPEERLELRSYDSAPYNQKLSDFFTDKKAEMELTGKKDYVLTPEDVTDANMNDIKKSFQPEEEDEML